MPDSAAGADVRGAAGPATSLDFVISSSSSSSSVMLTSHSAAMSARLLASAQALEALSKYPRGSR